LATPLQLHRPNESVPIVVDGARAFAPVIMGGVALNMVIDTGASESSIKAVVADRLLALNQATSGPDATFTLADGSSRTERTVFINTLTLGSHTVRNVHVSVTDENGIMLLGFDVLSQMRPPPPCWSSTEPQRPKRAPPSWRACVSP
jgi:hypothetical protein